jgi:hypoxanthine phosphoribosyltransferase
MEKVKLSNSDLINAIHKIAGRAAFLNADVIVAIERGGLPLATFLSYYLHLPLERIKVSFYKGTEKQETPIVELNNFDITKYKKPIFVDDLVDSGDTLQYIKQTYGDVTYATIFSRTIPAPDIYQYVKNADEWIVFPWDTENDGFDAKFAKVGWWKEFSA